VSPDIRPQTRRIGLRSDAGSLVLHCRRPGTNDSALDATFAVLVPRVSALGPPESTPSRPGRSNPRLLLSKHRSHNWISSRCNPLLTTAQPRQRKIKMKPQMNADAHGSAFICGFIVTDYDGNGLWGHFPRRPALSLRRMRAKDRQMTGAIWSATCRRYGPGVRTKAPTSRRTPKGL